MVKHFSRKLISAILTATMVVGMAMPTAFAENTTATNKKVRISAVSDNLLSLFQKKKEHVKSIEITDVSFDINRDFDQSCYVTVKNTSTENIEFFLSTDNPYDDIFLGFIEAGSATQPTLLTAGSSTKVKLSVFAQKATKNNYTLPVKAYVIEGTDNILDAEQEINLNLPDEELKFTCDLTSSNEDTLEQNYLITNNGNSLSSVSIYADETIENYISFEPGISETPIKANESISLKVNPNLSAMKEDNITKVEGNIVISSAGKEQKFSIVMDTQGREIHSMTMQQLIQYQKSNKEYYDVEIDTDAMQESLKIENNGSDTVIDNNTDYKISYSIPYNDRNTGEQIALREEKVRVHSYDGNEEAGTITNFDVSTTSDGKTIIKYRVILSTENIKDGIISKYLDSQSDNTGETEVDAVAETAKTAKLESLASYYGNISKDALDEVKTYTGLVADGTKLAADFEEAFDKTFPTNVSSQLQYSEALGTAYAWTSFGSNVYSTAQHMVDSSTFYNCDKIIDAPSSKISGAEKEQYIWLGVAKDWAGVAIAATGILLATTNPVGWIISASLCVGGFIFNKWADYKMKELEDKAGINDEDPEGGADTAENKRNQCTNAGKISVNWSPNFPGTGGNNPPSPTDPPTQPTDPPTQPTDPPTQPTDPPTQPTDPPTQAPTQAPTDPPTQAPTQTPTDPSTQVPTQAPTDPPTQAPTQAPTDPPTQAPTQAPTDPSTQAPTQVSTNPSTQPSTQVSTAPTEKATEQSTTNNKKWHFYLKFDKETVETNKDLHMWIESNVDLSKFVFKYQYQKENSLVWYDITNGYVTSKDLTTTFDKKGKYTVRVIIKSKNNPNLWFGVQKEITVTKSSNSFDDSTMNVFISTRLQAGDKSTNDTNMSTVYYVNGVQAGKTTNDGHSSLSMVVLDTSNVKIGNVNTITANYSTLPTHYRTVSDMEVITYYPVNTEVSYLGDLANHRDMTLKPDFAVYEENIYVDGNFYVNEQTTLHCDVYNKNLSGGWVDITVKDGDTVIYSAEDEWLSAMSSKNIDILWTPKTKDSQISVELVNKCMVTKEFSSSNNFAERKLTAIEYQVPEIQDITSTTALENREFSVYTNITNVNNLTDVKMYMDDTEINDLKSSVSSNKNNYWYNCKGLSAGKHTVKFVATYEKAGGKFGIVEKSFTFDVVSNSKSTATINKNSSTGNTNISADVYNGTSYVSSYTADTDGIITIPFTEAMYKNTSSYKVVVNTTKGIYITDLKTGTIKVNNNYVQNTFNVKGLNGIRYANLYIKGSDSSYYKQIQYSTFNKNGLSVVYFDNETYSEFSKAKDAYMLVVTNNNKIYKLQIIENGVRITGSDGSIQLSNDNIYTPVISSSAKQLGTIVLNAVENTSVSTLKSSWNTSYQGKADISISAFGSEILSKTLTNGKTVELPENDYVIDYTLKSDNYVFNIEKVLELNSNNYTNRIENTFNGKIETVESAETEDEISINVYDIFDKNNNELKYISAINNKPITITITFTDVNNSENVYTQTVKLNSFNGSIENVTVPDVAGDYKVSISMKLITETTMMGDLNSDGRITSADVSLMKKFIYGKQTPTSKQKTVADIDGSGTIDKKDLNLLKNML